MLDSDQAPHLHGVVTWGQCAAATRDDAQVCICYAAFSSAGPSMPGQMVATWQAEKSGLAVRFNAEECTNACKGFVEAAHWSRMVASDGQSSMSYVKYATGEYLHDIAQN
jgi:hypothetical protein